MSWMAVGRGLLRYLVLALSYRGSEVPQQHQELMDFALKRDSAGAVQVLEAHINECVAHALRGGELRC